MSALSEVDLRDFEKVDVDLLEQELSTLEPYPMFNIHEYCDTIRRIQKKLISQTPALFKPKEIYE